MKHATRQLNKATYMASIAIISLFACLSGCDFLAPIGNPIPNDSGILTDGQLTSNSSHDATELEQLALERINHARLWPAREAELGGITVDEGIPGQIDESPKQAVAMNNILRAAAKAHSEDMLVRDYFAHRNPDGDNPGDRVRANGYVWNLVGENLAWNGTTASLDPVEIIEQQHDNLFIDREIENRGHRLTMLHDDLREVGISIVRGSFTSGDVTYTDTLMQAQEYATSPGTGTFVLGVVYDDRNANGQYDFGEGEFGSTVLLNGEEKKTNVGGGYVFEVIVPGDYTITFESGRQVSLAIDPGDANIKIDSIDRTRVSVNLGRGALRK